MNTYSIDFETYYDDNVNVKVMGNENYVRATREIYLVAIHGPGVSFAGPLCDAPWDLINHARWCSHNAGFDQAVYREAVRRGQIPADVRPASWFCTADMSEYHQGGRALKDASAKLLGIHADKAYRAITKGQLFGDLSPEDRQTVITAGITDARVAYELAEKFYSSWPTFERRLSDLTIRGCAHGAPVDLSYADESVNKLLDVKKAAKKRIPWASSDKEEGILSLKSAREACLALDIEPPSSFAEDSEECQEWEADYGEKVDFVGALRDYRRANIMEKRLRRVINGTLDGFYRFGLLYFGAHTGRWAGTGGFNMQNMNREPISFVLDPAYPDARVEVDLRRVFQCPEGYTFVIRDLSNIENRGLAWACGQTALLDKIRSGMSPYEAFARVINLWSKPEGLKPKDGKGDKTLYAIAKAMVLGLGYGCGPKKFPTVARAMGGEPAMEFLYNRATELREESKTLVDLGGEEPEMRYCLTVDAALEQASREVVDRFRNTNPEVVGLWEYFDDTLRRNLGGSMSMELPSGRVIRYSGIRNSVRLDPVTKKPKRVITAVTSGTMPRAFWGGTLTENYIQAFCRDIFGYGLLRYEDIRDADCPLLWTAHDEAVTMAPIEKAEKVQRALDEALTAPIPFCPTLPLASEGVTSRHYVK